MKRSCKRWVVSVLFICIALILLSLLFFSNKFRSLSTLQRIDDYPIYRMRYYGDYKFDEFLKTGAKSDKDIIRFISANLLNGTPFTLGSIGAGCTAFIARNEKGELIYGAISTLNIRLPFR